MFLVLLVVLVSRKVFPISSELIEVNFILLKSDLS